MIPYGRLFKPEHLSQWTLPLLGPPFTSTSYFLQCAIKRGYLGPPRSYSITPNLLTPPTGSL
jgi:hypothetical protein